MNSRTERLLIVGGGPAGLATAYAYGNGALVLERRGVVGGLCRSIEHDGGVFDLGGHSFHTPHPEVRALVEDLLDGDLYLQKREATVYSHGTLIPYPFQKNFDRIPDKRVVRECELGLAAVSGAPSGEPENFEEYIIQKFGKGIAEHFMLPYNSKLWARDIRKISCEWTSERVAAPKGATESFDTRGGERKPLQADTRVGYPAQGGFQEIFTALAKRLPAVEVECDIESIDWRNRTATAADGREYQWDRLVSTVPLPEFVKIVQEVPSAVAESAAALEYMSLRVELLLTGRRLDTEVQRIYCADPEIPPHKIALNHNSSDSLRARDRHAIMAEVSLSAAKQINPEEIAPRTVDLLTRLGILRGFQDITWTGHVDVKYAYPVYTHSRPAALETIKGWLQDRNIFTVGRFGDWKYENSDKCLHAGLRLGQKLRESRGTPPATT